MSHREARISYPRDPRLSLGPRVPVEGHSVAQVCRQDGTHLTWVTLRGTKPKRHTMSTHISQDWHWYTQRWTNTSTTHAVYFLTLTLTHKSGHWGLTHLISFTTTRTPRTLKTQHQYMLVEHDSEDEVPNYTLSRIQNSGLNASCTHRISWFSIFPWCPRMTLDRKRETGL
jgi:hypothetical protein